MPQTSSLCNLPNAISAARIALTPAVAWAFVDGRGALALAGFTVVVASDVLDGYVARRRGGATAFGTLLDHGADALFVTTLTALAAHRGLLPIALAPLIAIAFMQYALDSRTGGHAAPRPSPLGRWNGIAYYVAAGAAIVVQAYLQEFAPAATALLAAGWALVATSAISIAQRARHTVRHARDH